jgi:hypothetical protein
MDSLNRNGSSTVDVMTNYWYRDIGAHINCITKYEYVVEADHIRLLSASDANSTARRQPVFFPIVAYSMPEYEIRMAGSRTLGES